MKDTADTEPETPRHFVGRPLSREGMRSMQGGSPERGEPTDHGIQDIPLSAVDTRALNVYGPEDPRGDSYDQIADGCHKLNDTVRPGVQAGYGRDHFLSLDKAQGLDPATNGYTKAYDSFYGDNPITVLKDGQRYEVDKGRHRLFVAKQEGLTSVPARVKEFRPPPSDPST